MRKRSSVLISIVSFALIVACSCGPLASVLPGGGGDFPYTPAPLDVVATLDTERAASYRPGGYFPTLETESADGVLSSMDLIFFVPLVVDENAELLPGTGTVVTMTPVSAIDGLPFSQGFLGAVHLGPEGILTVEPAYLTMEIPGEYDPAELIGFAAEGNGEEFHLYPVTVASFDGTTYVHFEIMHFSIYGVARALQSEIVAQQARPPTNPASQDDQDLAPLMPIRMNKIQQQLHKSYTRLLSNDLRNLETMPCSKVDVVAYNFNVWLSRVSQADETEYFKGRIESNQNLLLDRLTECIREVCVTCLNPQAGVTPNSRDVSRMIVLINFARQLSSALHQGDARSTYWWRLEYECSRTAGLPLPSAGIASDGGAGSDPLTCP